MIPWQKKKTKMQEDKELDASEKGDLPERFCKTCGCELASTSKYDSCEACRRKTGDIAKAVGVVVLPFVAFAAKKAAPKILKAVKGALGFVLKR